MELHGENPLKNVIAIIPARYGSVRLPGKLLLPIAGRPLILHTVDRAKAATSISRVIVATDDKRIRDTVIDHGAEAVMTSADHRSGTDRVAEVADDLPGGAIIVNVQGDEPLIAPETIDATVKALIDDDDAQIATTAELITDLAELLNGNVVKVVTGDAGYAIHFSRSPMPYPRDAALRHGGNPNRALEEEPELLSIFRKHTGLYVYRREYLLRMSKLPQTTLEKIEMLEQLRALEDGARIRVVDAASNSIGVDTEEDYRRVIAIVEKKSIKYREATREDIPEIARVHIESWKRSFKGITSQEHLDSMSIEKRIGSFERAFAQDAFYRILVAETPEKRIVGFADFGEAKINKSFDTQIYAIYFLPEFQRKGIGETLFRLCQREMAARGFKTMCLDTLEVSPYRAFYEKMGGVVVGESSHDLAGKRYKTLIYGWSDLGNVV